MRREVLRRKVLRRGSCPQHGTHLLFVVPQQPKEQLIEPLRPAATALVFKLLALRLGGRRVSKEGVLMIEASRFRSQERNREDARERLKELILEAAAPSPPVRKATKPTKGSVERRLKAKSGRSDVKKMRGKPSGD